MISNNSNLNENYTFYQFPFPQYPQLFEIIFFDNKTLLSLSSLIKQEDTTPVYQTPQLAGQTSQLHHQTLQQIKLEANDSDELKQKKSFKKDKYCPVRVCNKKYSSRIALRAHLRKKHPTWEVQTSDYEP